jgi:hypothetical protein
MNESLCGTVRSAEQFRVLTSVAYLGQSARLAAAGMEPLMWRAKFPWLARKAAK